MSNPYRALCAELIEAVLSDDSHIDCVEIAHRARALLAQPEPEVPTDEEIMELMPQQLRDDLSHAARVQLGFDNPKAAGAMRIILNRYAVNHARAALAKWGRHPESPDSSTQPIPLSERLPGPEDCLDEGWAWFFNQRIGWRQAVLPVSPGYTHWLPANALPTPELEALDD
jgi:hypothetical protein